MGYYFQASKRIQISLITLFVGENFSLVKFRHFSPYSSGKIIRRGKFSSPGQNFVTFPQRIFPRQGISFGLGSLIH